MAEERNFFSRWSQRKGDVAKGKVLDEPAPPVVDAISKLVAPPQPVPASPEPDQPAKVEAIPALTLEDVKALNAESDFSPFAAKNVAPDVRNAAMKKLFTDPHYNVMDGLDIYIDDYSKSDPIPESMLRQMVGAQFLKLFESEPAAETIEATEAKEDNGAPNLSTQHAHADLRLQPDPATGGTQNLGNAEPGLERASGPAQRPLPP